MITSTTINSIKVKPRLAARLALGSAAKASARRGLKCVKTFSQKQIGGQWHWACFATGVDHNARMSKSLSFGHSVFPGDVPAGLVAAQRPWAVVAAGVFWLAAGLSAGYWVLQAWGRTPVVPVSATAAALPASDTRSVAMALGVTAAPVVAGQPAAPAVVATRYTLIGVVSDRRKQGAALIAVDGQPPKPYPVGAELEGGMVLQSVNGRTVRLGPSMSKPHSLELTLPPQPEGA
jgi:general secretion pathway protein C